MKRLFLTVFALAALLVLAPPVASDAAAANLATTPAKSSTPLIYVLRGGADIFSTGMDTLADELNKRGIPAESLNFSHWRELVDTVSANYRTRRIPIIVVGHSWGANSALLMAMELKKSSIPVALMVFYDATASLVMPPNVDWVINFRSSAAIGLDITVTGGYGFQGKIDTVDAMDVDHIQVDKTARLHKQTLDAIAKVMGSAPRAATQ